MPTPSLTHRVFDGVVRITAGGIAARSVSIVSAPVLALVLASDDYGLAALVATVVALLSVFAIRGLDIGYVRRGADPSNPQFRAVERYVWGSALGAAGVLSLGGGATWWWGLAGHASAPRSLAVMVALGVLFSVWLALARTAARIRGWYGRFVVGAVVSVGATIGIAVTARADFWALLLCSNFGLAASALLFQLGPLRIGAGEPLPRRVRRHSRASASMG